MLKINFTVSPASIMLLLLPFSESSTRTNSISGFGAFTTSVKFPLLESELSAVMLYENGMLVWSAMPSRTENVYAFSFVDVPSAAMFPNDSLSSLIVMSVLDDAIVVFTLLSLLTAQLYYQNGFHFCAQLFLPLEI